MKTLTLIAASTLVLASFATTAFASSDNFTTIDANRDKGVSMSEAMGAYPTLTAHFFDQADENHNGILDEQEYLSLIGLSAAF